MNERTMFAEENNQGDVGGPDAVHFRVNIVNLGVKQNVLYAPKARNIT